MIAVLPRSSSRRRRSPRLLKRGISPLRRRRVIGAAAAGEKLALGVEDARLGDRKWAAQLDDLAVDGEVTWHRRGVIVDAQADGGYAATNLLDHGPVRAEIDERGQYAAVGVASVRIDHPLFPPCRTQFDTVVMQRDHFQSEPLMVGGAGDQFLHALQRDFLTHGATTTLPMTSRSWIRRSPSRASPSGSTLSITGRILPAAMSFISACRSSS